MARAGLDTGFAYDRTLEAPLRRRFTVPLRAGLVVSLSCGAALAHAHDGAGKPSVAELSAQGSSTAPATQAAQPEGTLRVQLLGLNDFHGRLTTGLVEAKRPIGGAAVLASYLRAEQAAFHGPTFIVHAGDHVGASQPESGLLQDEPSIAFLNMLANEWCQRSHGRHPRCNVVGTLGNHEFDEGLAEIKRLIQGGKHARGPFLEPHYHGASYPYVSANVVEARSGRRPFTPFVVRKADGVAIGFIGAILEDAPSVLTPEGGKGLSFLDEAEAINAQVAKLRRQGVESIVVLIHQGTAQPVYLGATRADQPGPGGAIAEVVSRLDGAVDVVVSGHAHSFTNALLPNAAGKPTLVTQAFSSGMAYADIELTIDRKTHDVIEKSATIRPTFADEGPGLTPAADVAALVARAQQKTADIVGRELGVAQAPITRALSPAGESALGNLIADAQREAMGTSFAFMNPGGIRADLDGGPITWGDLLTVQPFGNALVRMDLTGAQVLTLLEQQWANAERPRLLQVSGLRVTYDSSRSVGQRVLAVDVAGVPLDPAALYSVTVNSFMAEGGDGFSVLKQGTHRVRGPADIDALTAHVQRSKGALATAIEGRLVLASPAASATR
jgi:5'-nucleotidase